MHTTTNRPSSASRWAQSLESDRRLDDLTGLLRRAAAATVGQSRVKAALQGRAMGHALHPALVDLPLGSLTSALLLDTVQGEAAEQASRLLVAAATVSLAPTIASGLAEWDDADERTQRVGAAHALLNLVGGLLTASSWMARSLGRRDAGVWLTSAALTAFTVSAYLGGHMSLVRKYATHDVPTDLEGATRGTNQAATR